MSASPAAASAAITAREYRPHDPSDDTFDEQASHASFLSALDADLFELKSECDELRGGEVRTELQNLFFLRHDHGLHAGGKEEAEQGEGCREEVSSCCCVGSMHRAGAAFTI